MENQDVNDKIDILKIINTLWKKKIYFFLTCSIGFIIGIIVSFSIPKTYKSEVTLAPEISSSSGLSGNLSDIASMVGVDLGKSGGASVDAIYPEIYPEVISSTPFIINLFDVKISTKDKSLNNIRLYDYLKSYQKAPWWSGVFAWIGKVFKKEEEQKDATSSTLNPRELNKEQNGILAAIKSSLSCTVDKKTSIISISTTTQDPLVSAILADTIQERLQKYIIAYRTKKARNDLNYVENTYKRAKTDYEKARKKYGEFGDANQDLTQQSVITERDELENDMQLKYNLLTQTFQQVQMAKDRLRERTPAFTQIQPSTVPLKKDGPKRMTITFVFTFLAFVLTTIVILFKDAQKNGTNTTVQSNTELQENSNT